MTVSQVPTYSQAPGNGSAVAFAFPFLIFETADLEVGFIDSSQNYVQVTTGFTVAGLGIEGQGIVTFSVPPPTGITVDIRSNFPETQPNNFANFGRYLPETNTKSQDRLARQIQDLRRLTYQFGLHGPDNESTAWPALPGPPGRAGGTIVFDATTGLPGVGFLTAINLTQAIFNAYLATAPVGGVRTALEIANSVFPVNLLLSPGNVLRYGNNTIPGTTDMTTALQNALLCNPAVLVPSSGGPYLCNGQLTISSNQAFFGDGYNSAIMFTNPNQSNIIGTGVTDASVRALRLSVSGNGTQSYVGVVNFTGGSTYCVAQGLEISGNSGCGVLLTDSSNSLVSGNYFHNFNLTNNNNDVADIYVGIGSGGGCKYNVIEKNQCFGGAFHGIIMLTGSGAPSTTKNQYNTVDSNRVGQHAAYGIADYSGNGNFELFNQITNNYVENIQGTALSGASGAGIYTAAVAGDTITGNTIRNCCVHTSAQTLAPGGIGINNQGNTAGMAPTVVSGNNVAGMTNYHGIYVVSSANPVSIAGNAVQIPAGNGTGNGILVNSCSNANVQANTVANLSSNAAILLQAGAAVNDNSISGNVVTSAGAGISTNDTTGSGVFQKTLVTGNNVSVSVGSAAYILTKVAQGSFSDNVGSTQVAAAAALATCSQLRVGGNYLVSNGTYALTMTGNCSDTLVDESNYLQASATTYSNAVNDSSTGSIVSQYGSAVPTAGAHAVGGRIIQSVPTVGNPKGWRCTVNGSPGTWVSEGNL